MTEFRGVASPFRFPFVGLTSILVPKLCEFSSNVQIGQLNQETNVVCGGRSSPQFLRERLLLLIDQIKMKVGYPNPFDGFFLSLEEQRMERLAEGSLFFHDGFQPCNGTVDLVSYIVGGRFKIRAV